MYKREKMAAAFWIIIFAIFVGLTGGVNEKCRSFPYFVCAIGSNGVQGVQTRLKRKDRFESK